jgi:hypothetical protein
MLELVALQAGEAEKAAPARLPGEPAHAEAVREAIHRAGWAGTKFDVYRCRVEYPVLFTMFAARVDVMRR